MKTFIVSVFVSMLCAKVL